MALTRAQLLSGNTANGVVLAGQPQGVRPGGSGITIGADGIIAVDSQSIIGVMKMGQTPASAAAAYNQYDWPIGAPTAGQQLTAVTVAGVTTLGWTNASGIPWTAKGQLIVGTGVGTDTLLSVGTDTSLLIADSASASGLAYSNGITSAMLAPAGTTAQRPSPATAGQIRYNTTTGKFEFATGAATWEEVASGDPAVNGFVQQSIPSAPGGATGNALIPAGSTAQRQTAPAVSAGSTRFNTDTGELEVYGGTGWATVPSSTTGAFVEKTVPTAPATATANVVVPAGSTANRQTSPAVAAGEMRFNTTTGKLEVYGGGGTWEEIPSSSSGTYVGQTVPTAGTASAIIPAGTTAQQQTLPAPAAGYLRFNTTTTLLEVFNGTVWTAAGAPPTAGLGIDITGSIVKVAIPQQSTPPVVGAGAAQAIVGSLYWDDTLSQLFIYYSNGGAPTWVQAAPAAGGSSYTGTLPINVSGTTIAINQGLGVATNGNFLVTKVPEATAGPAAGTGAAQAIVGSTYYDTNLGAMFVYYSNGGAPTWVMV